MAAAKKKAKKTKPKTTKATKPKAAATGAEQPAPKIFNTAMDEEQRALFIGETGHLKKIKELRARLNTANANLRAGYKSAKAHGFDKQDFDYAIQLETVELEAKTRARIARNLVIAKYVGSSLGAQLDLFLEPDRTPAVDIAYDEGKAASMRGEPAKPGYDPSTPQHAQYMQGYHDDQGKRVKGGIKPLENDKGAKNGKPEAAPKGAAKGADALPAASAPILAPTSGVALSRSAFLAQQQLAREAAEKRSDQSATEGDPAAFEEQVDDDGPSAFQRRH